LFKAKEPAKATNPKIAAFCRFLPPVNQVNPPTAAVTTDETTIFDAKEVVPHFFFGFSFFSAFSGCGAWISSTFD
jgi:hypothetical protein